MRVSMPSNKDSKELLKKATFIEHLEELRSRIIKSLLAILIVACISYIFSTQILEYIIIPVERLIFITPTEAFLARIKVSIIAGVFIALPFVLYQIWSFVKPGLYKRERRSILPIVIVSSFFLWWG
jgi:sec-independent protein translocase protein TatC